MLHTYRYYFVGPTLAYLQQIGHPDTVSVGPVRPVQITDVLVDETGKGQTDDAMAAAGWAFLETDPPIDGAMTVNQIVTVTLTDDGSPISGAWTDVLTVPLQSNGGKMAVQVAAIAQVTLATAQTRITIEGGVYQANTVIGAPFREFAILGLNDTAFNHPVELPDGMPGPDGSKAYTTYTVRLQMQRTGLGTVTPKKGCVLTCVEYKAG